MTVDAILNELIGREGDFTDDPLDRGGATKYGITAATLGNWRGWSRPATRAEVEALTVPEAKAIYTVRYLEQPGFAQIPSEPLRVALMDDGVNSGPAAAIKRLQRVLGVSQDGVLGPITLTAVREYPDTRLLQELVKARCLAYARIVQADPSQRRFLVGWLTRAFTFLPERA